MKNLKSQCPREYWKILNASVGGKQNNIDIPLEKLLEHFRNLSAGSAEVDDIVDPELQPLPPLSEINLKLDRQITEQEIIKAISTLKNGKASGNDHIKNELLKSLPHEYISILCKHFNTILDSGIIPREWGVGTIMPLFKNKGSALDPGNYRGITLLSCISKLFTAILNKRITELINNDLGLEQAGFRAGHSTMDHVFVLHHVIDFYRQKGKQLYCAFVDYSKAFDLVNRSALWYKLISHGVSGKVLTVIKNIYRGAKSCIRVNGALSDFFACSTGVRQGENLSPILFAIFLNDFKTFLSSKYNGLSLGKECGDLEPYARLYVLLYADDTVILAESEDELQNALHALKAYCDKWGLVINRDKTQIVIFSKGKISKHRDFFLGSDMLAVVEDYTYLGVVMNYNGKFIKAVCHQKRTACRAMHAILAKARILDLDVDTIFELFQRCVVPILLYGCEIWGGEKAVEMVDIFYKRFIKIVLKVPVFTPTCMIYGESGQPPLKCLVDSRMVGFWVKLMFDETPRLSKTILTTMEKIHENNKTEDETAPKFIFNWLLSVRKVLQNIEFSGLWYQDQGINLTEVISSRQILYKAKAKIISMHQSNLLREILSHPQCTVYQYFKKSYGQSSYLSILNSKLRETVCKFLTRNHNLPVVANRFVKKDQQSVLLPTTCHLCRNNETGDELHYLFVCPCLNEERKTFLGPLLGVNGERPDPSEMFCEFFGSNDPKILTPIAKFVSLILDRFTYEKPMKALEVRQCHTTRAGRLTNRPRYLEDFFV